MGFGKDGKGVIITEKQTITCSTLGAGAAIKAASNVAIQDDFRIIKTQYWITLSAFIEDESWIVGLADNELSTTEIANQIAVNGPVDRNDHSNVDLANKPVWLLEAMDTIQSGTGAAGFPHGLKQGEKVFRWTFSDTEGWTWFIYNPQTSAMAGGIQVIVTAKHFGVWVT